MHDLFKADARAYPTAPEYTAADIEVLEGLEPVRRRPGMFIGGTAMKRVTAPEPRRRQTRPASKRGRISHTDTLAAGADKVYTGRGGPIPSGTPSTAFNVCTFWYIEALAALGRTDEARSLFEGMLAARNPAGLLSEDIEPASGELWGNFPQTYSMVGLIHCAMRLSKSWEEAF